MKIFRKLLAGLLFAMSLHSTFLVHGQQAGPAARSYTYLIYHKLAPGLTIQDALPVEREWRTLNQAAVEEGNLIGWYMMTKQFTSNPNQTEYDYVTVIVSREMAIKGASPAARAKIYGDSAQARMADLQKRDRLTAPVVKIEIWETVDAVFGSGFAPDKTPMVVLDYMRLRDPAADWQSLLAPMKRQGTDGIRGGKLAGWSVSALKVPNGSEKGYSLALARCGTTLGDMLGGETAIPAAEQAKFRTQQARTFDVVRQDVFRLTEYTINKKLTTEATR